MLSINGLTVNIEELNTSQKQEMWQLYKKHYSSINNEVFLEDLKKKTHVILLNDKENILRGFSTLENYSFPFQGALLNIVFSGNTIIQPEFWGSLELVWAWNQYMTKLISEKPDLPLYWFLICSGFRTYRFLPVFFKEFYPRYDKPTPCYEKSLLDALAKEKFSEEYQEGVIHVKDTRECLSEGLANPKKRLNPHVEFFFKKNLDFKRGNELVCLTNYTTENLRDSQKNFVIRRNT